MNDEFGALLERIRQHQHPDYGTLSWNGHSREVTVTVAFGRNGIQEPDEMIRTRALRYLEGLTQEEQAIVDLDITFREGKPVKAILRAATGELSAKRLRELAKQAGL